MEIEKKVIEDKELVNDLIDFLRKLKKENPTYVIRNLQINSLIERLKK